MRGGGEETNSEHDGDVMPEEAPMLLLFVLSVHADTHGKSRDTVFHYTRARAHAHKHTDPSVVSVWGSIQHHGERFSHTSDDLFLKSARVPNSGP